MNDDNVHWYLCYIDMTTAVAYVLDSLMSNRKAYRLTKVGHMVIDRI